MSDSDSDSYMECSSDEVDTSEEEDYCTTDGLDYNEYHGPQPYQYEPRRRSQRRASQHDPTQPNNNQIEPNGQTQTETADTRLGHCKWCQCGHCQPMATETESKCCREYKQIMTQIERLGDPHVHCITQHPGFSAGCLNEWALEIAQNAYRQQYGRLKQQGNKTKRHFAYRQTVQWCWGYLGKYVRVVLPSCVVRKVREMFPSRDSNYTGFLNAQT